jgi:hypothetical protein
MKINNSIKCKSCFGQEFVTEPNQYDIYEVFEEKLILLRTEQVDDVFRLYCRDCSEELVDVDNLIT